MKKSISMLLLAAAILPLMGKDLPLMEKGKSKCVIVKSDAKCPVQDFAARELSLFLGKSAKGEKPVIADKAVKGKTVIAFAGAVTPDARVCNDHGIDAFFPAVRKPCTLDEAMDPEKAKSNLADTAEQVFRVINTITFRS